jgi:hypothetical protein
MVGSTLIRRRYHIFTVEDFASSGNSNAEPSDFRTQCCFPLYGFPCYRPLSYSIFSRHFLILTKLHFYVHLTYNISYVNSEE